MKDNTVMLGTTVLKSEWDALEALAKELGIHKAEAVRRAVRYALAHPEILEA